MEDKKQIFHYRSWSIVLFCWRNWIFMRWHKVISVQNMSFVQMLLC